MSKSKLEVSSDHSINSGKISNFLYLNHFYVHKSLEVSSKRWKSRSEKKSDGTFWRSVNI